MENPTFLKKFKGIGNAPEVMDTKKRTERRSGEKVKGNFELLIQNYLNRFTEFKDDIHETKNEKIKERAMERFKAIIMDKFLTKYEDIPENYWAGPFTKEITEKGMSGDWNNMDDKEKEKYKKDYARPLIEDQKASIEEWLDYFMEDDSDDIPDYLKYWAFRSVTGLQEYEKPKDWTKEDFPSSETKVKKEEGKFPRRSKNTLKKFPDLHHEALRYVVEAIKDKYEGKGIDFEYDIQSDEKEKFKKYLEQENFAKLYAWAMELINPIPEHLLPVTKGGWKKYPQGSNVNEVTATLRGKGTGLCIAGKGAAKNYLNSGDLHIFYSNDEEGNPAFPRIAIHSKDDKIAEMRGIAYKQNIDPFITDVAREKLHKFSNGEKYEKQTDDMKQLTEIENKTKNNQELTKNDLIFLYEIDNSIDGFGYQRDPRIEEIRNTRKIEEDVVIIFECEPSQIAKSKQEINEDTKAYVGEWNIDVFEKVKNYPNIIHLYESFPDKKIFMMNLETDPNINSPEKAKQTLIDKNIYLSDLEEDILNKTEFSKEKQNYDLVKFTVKQLGFQNSATTDQIYEKAKELGLELCPAEVGPHLRLQYLGKEYMNIAIKQIADRDGVPSVSHLSWYGG
ncbi:MAG: hypothetical protein ABIA02_03635 [Candidatus Falkowbacteria bacterium]